jgi:hypothetical protein
MHFPKLNANALLSHCYVVLEIFLNLLLGKSFLAKKLGRCHSCFIFFCQLNCKSIFLPTKRTLYLLFIELLQQRTAVVAAVFVLIVASYMDMWKKMVPRSAAEDYYAQPWEELWNTSCRTVDVETVVVLVDIQMDVVDVVVDVDSVGLSVVGVGSGRVLGIGVDVVGIHMVVGLPSPVLAAAAATSHIHHIHIPSQEAVEIAGTFLFLWQINFYFSKFFGFEANSKYFWPNYLLF